jgi:PadR family transcriptional regulator AphA
MPKQDNKTLSPLKEIILATLASDDTGHTGYDLSKTLYPAWQASHQQVYRELNIMAEMGLVVPKSVPQVGKPDRKDYYMTDKGLKVYGQIKSEVPVTVEPLVVRSESVSKMVVGNWVYFERLIEVLDQNIQRAKEALSDSHTKYGTCYEKLLLQRKLAIWEAEREFAKEALTLTSGAMK